MGQISLPIANRTGLSIHWASSGDSAYNNATIHTKDYYVRSLVSLIYKSYMPFFTLSKPNFKALPGLYLFESDKTDNDVFDRFGKGDFSVFSINQSYELKVPAYRQQYDEKTLELIEKALPIYNGNTLILRNNNCIIIVVKYFSIIRSNWYKQVKNYEHTLRSKKSSTKYGIYKKKIKRFRKTKSNPYINDLPNNSF